MKVQVAWQDVLPEARLGRGSNWPQLPLPRVDQLRERQCSRHPSQALLDHESLTSFKLGM